MLENLHQSQDPVPPRIPEELTPERMYWKTLEPAFMKEEVPETERLNAHQRDVMDHLYELMDTIAARAVAEKRDFNDLDTLIAWGISENIVSPEDGNELANWFKPTVH